MHQFIGKTRTWRSDFDGKDLLKITEKELRIERQKMGMIFQHFNLMKSRTVYENIAFPLRHLKMDKEQIEQKSHGTS